MRGIEGTNMPAHIKRNTAAIATALAAKSATVDVTRWGNGFIPLTTGNAVIQSPNDTAFQTFAVVAGYYYPIQVRRVNTTSVDLHLCFNA